jgi:sec-independent protein translocase protein TatA
MGTLIMVMNVMFAGMIGGWEMIVILAVVLMLFGAKKLPELAKGLGQGIKEFKKATREVTDEVTQAMDETPAPQRRLPATAATPASPVQTSVQADSIQTVPQSSPATKA